MRVDDFDFELPEECIALRPAEPRDAAKLLVVRPEARLEDRIARDLPDLLSPGDILVFNNTRVISGQLSGTRERDGNVVAVSATLIERIDSRSWWSFAKPGRRLAPGDRIRFGEGERLSATVGEKLDDGRIRLDFDLSGPALDIAIAETGAPPLPPYIASKRAADERDRSDYQTVYAEKDGAVAAPTAGLHFTDDLLRRLEKAGIGHAFVTLHVGAGTFLPVKVDDTADHHMHTEIGTLDQATADRLNAARAAGHRVVAVGTTSMRLLESAAGEDDVIRPFSGGTDIFITPGYRFRAVDAMVTNFHLPRSTLFMLVSAFAGLETMKAAYGHAIASGYRFYSYGDGSLLFPDRKT
ncbi:S-adenosylmethionine:tRNA ribosyltransferase-isomerase [Faunimonas pinastri]|uniref:S-adenosylmethionine:tRNA ribosyltransferase-isomerase n=1 Tax=Faunimonas pinastri TaxID=1855383 RepID=A0A1H9QI07_9HYPH|nr:tRNA preQ1(34) S-adenosylmethionine ribosyltransferase-isomerase QueA [Faunimonas pinastri]SER60156.1 S-adenosylmethionine:tRNA ribosyltransferase-isomerase [Faunimonas pinastri]